ncbi:hypothetical protein [Dietzia sp. KRD202]|uniref:hypothetical protein n=1 Tax=Dietzia sp. KRD202 TaxID=2729732 RepID=UPI0019D16F39|nr:hypothetical protein [Dietzia sp. KRD202]
MTAAVPITTVCDLTVPWVPFRRALCAVLPHAAKDKEDSIPALIRVRIYARPDRVYVAASDRFTVALALVETLVPPTEEHHLDLHPEEVRKILAVFPERKDELDYTLRLVASPEQLEIRDISGMVDGERLAVNLLPAADDFPDLPRALARYTHRDPVDSSRPAWPLEFLTRFKAALKCWDESRVRLSMIGLSHGLVIVGEHFIGAITGADAAEEIDTDRAAWAICLADDLPPLDRMAGVIDITNWTTEADQADTEGDTP